MKNQGARTDRRMLASTCWLLLLAGLSCKYNVTLPWTPSDARAPVADSAFDQSPTPSPDTSFSGPDGPGPDAPSPDAPSPDAPSPDAPSPDARVCPGGNYQDWPLSGYQVQILVAMDRSNSMLREFDSNTAKAQAAWAAVNTSAELHPRVLFKTSSFPWTTCGTAACCATYYVPLDYHQGPVDASLGCGPFDPGCLPSTNDSPSHKALQLAGSYINGGKGPGNWGTKSTLVLITDQAPSCSGDSPTDSACPSAVNEASNLGNQDVQTFVLLPSADVRTTPGCLDSIAKSNAHYFSDAQQLSVAKNSQELSKKLDDIVSVAEKKLCRFPFEAVFLDQIQRVKIGNDFILRDDTGRTGWAWDSASGEIALSGNACAKILTSVKSIEVKVGVCYSGSGSGWP